MNRRDFLGKSAVSALSLTVTGTTQSTSTTTGSGIFAGGVGIAKTLVVGENIGAGGINPLKRLHALETSAGNATWPLLLTNNSSSINTTVGMQFNPTALAGADNYTASIIAKKISAGAVYSTDLIVSVTNSAGSLVEGLRLVNTGQVSTGGLAAPDGVAGSLHVWTGTAGTVTADANADELIVETAGDGGISILSPDSSTGALYFGSPSDNDGAIIAWRQATPAFVVASSVVGASLILKAGAEITNLTLSGAAGAEDTLATKALRAGGTITAGTALANQLLIYGSGAGDQTTIEVTGSDTNAGIDYKVKGGDSHIFYTASTSRVIIDGNGHLTVVSGDLIITAPTTPASAAATGTIGTIAWDTGSLCVATATDTSTRVAIATWP